MKHLDTWNNRKICQIYLFFEITYINQVNMCKFTQLQLYKSYNKQRMKNDYLNKIIMQNR